MNWKDEAHLIPPVVCKIKLRIIRTRILEFSALDGEFIFDEDDE